MIFFYFFQQTLVKNQSGAEIALQTIENKAKI